MRSFYVTPVLATLVVSGVFSSTAMAQDYPNKTIRLIVPYPPGGGNDALARLFGQKLSAAWGNRSSSTIAPAPVPP